MADDILQRLRDGVTTAGSEATRQLGHELATQLPTDFTLALHGDLGTGKTTFVSGMAAALGITQPVTSPTYNIYHLYQGERLLVHLDAYRLEKASDTEGLMLEDLLTSPWLLVVEWPERFDAAWLVNALRLELTFIDETTRRIRLISADQMINSHG